MTNFGPKKIVKQFIKLTPKSVLDTSFTEIDLINETPSHLITDDFKLAKSVLNQFITKQETLDNGEKCLTVVRHIRDLEQDHEDWEHDFEFYHHVTEQVLINYPGFKDIAVNSDGEITSRKEYLA